MFGWGGQQRTVDIGVLAEAALRTSRVLRNNTIDAHEEHRT